MPRGTSPTHPASGSCSSPFPVAWLAGAPCAGKSTAAWELYTAEISAGRRVAYVDIDQLGMVLPAPAGDPRLNEIKGEVVGRLLRNFAAAGAQSAIVSGVVEPADVPAYRRECRGSAVTFTVLTADRTTLTARLRERYDDVEVASALDFDARLRESDFAAAVVDTTAMTPTWVAQRLSALGPSSLYQVSEGSAFQPVVHAGGVCVWVHGAPAIGKSSVAWPLFMQLVQEGGAGYVDTGQLSFLGGVAAGSPQLLKLQAANVAAAWEVFSKAGARWLVISGLLTRPDAVRVYQRALPQVEFRTVRLDASDQEIRTRVFRRGQGGGPNLAGDLLAGQQPSVLEAAATASQDIAHRLAACDLPGAIVDTTGVDVATVVSRVRHALGV